MAKAKTPANKAALTRKRRATAKKAATTRKRRRTAGKAVDTKRWQAIRTAAESALVAIDEGRAADAKAAVNSILAKCK